MEVISPKPVTYGKITTEEALKKHGVILWEFMIRNKVLLNPLIKNNRS